MKSLSTPSIKLEPPAPFRPAALGNFWLQL